MAISKSTNWHQKMWPWPTWLFHPAIKIGSFGAGSSCLRVHAKLKIWKTGSARKERP